MEFFFVKFLIWNIIFFSTVVIFSKQPIHSIFSLILVFFLTACLLLRYNVEFLAMILIIVYVGAIAVLFLFMVMMLNIRENSKQDNFASPLLFIVIVKLFLITDTITISKFEKNLYYKQFSEKMYEVLYKTNDIFLFSDFLYNYFYYYIILGAFLLLLSMVGALVMALDIKK